MKLSGNLGSHPRPDFSWQSLGKGSFQSAFDDYWENGLIPRGLAIKTYNQIQLDCFGLSNKNIIGKNYDLFEEGYIKDALAIGDYDFSSPKNDNAMVQYVSELEEINIKLRKHDKYLLVYSTPSKGMHDYENIPYKYKLQGAANGCRAIDSFRKYISRTDVPYLDSEKVLSNNEYPIFYPTGIHWSRPAEQEVDSAVINKLCEISGKKLRHAKLGTMNSQSMPYWRDADLSDLLNVFVKPKQNITYYEYTESYEASENYDKLRMFLEGGSFAQGLTKNPYTSDEIYETFYSDYIWSPITGECTSILDGDWSKADFSKYLDKVDFVVIEINEMKMKDFSDGFADYLDTFLDTYGSGQ